MINNLFSIFDPSTSLNFRANWIVLTIFLILFPYTFWISSSLFVISWKILLKKIFQEITNNLKSSKTKNIILITCIFITILFRNLLGLLPYIFTSSSHLIFTIFLAFPIWISLIIFRIINKFNKFIRHLVPLGSPIF